MSFKILVCDDEENIRESVKLILDDEPYLQAFAANGREVIKKVTEFKPDIIILDIKMPKLSGLDAIEQIKAINPDVKIIMISGYEQPDVIKEALSRGASDYLPKSFSGRQLKDAIKRILKKKS